MKSPILLVGLLATAACSAVITQAADDPIWGPITDGKSLAGWHKNGLGEWTVEGGAFIGRSNKEKLYGHLVSDDKFKDFTVRFDFKCTGGDSGFFIRTLMKEPDKTHGLQIQVGPCGSGTGGIYESYGRGWLQKPTADQEAFCYRKNGWNEMIISARGPYVTVHVNGFKTADLNDNKIKQEAGVLALQMHSGVVNETMFKDLAILKKGQLVPRKFLYDSVAPVQAGKNGSIDLSAADAMSVSPSIRYMPEWGAMGSFTQKDHVYWPVTVKEAGTYNVWLEWSVPDKQAGNSFAFKLGDQQLSGKTAGTGSWNTYKRANVGKLTLKPGVQQAVFRPQGDESGKRLLNLRKIELIK